MTERRSTPPTAAVWLLQHGCPGKNDVLLGDLLERFHEGKPVHWFWWQVFVAVTLRYLGALRRHMPELSYAIVGMVGSVFFAHARFTFWLHWWTLPWPLSQIVMEKSTSIAVALAALALLAIGLVIAQRFRWMSLLRTGVLSVAVITLMHYALDMVRPWITRPIPGSSNGRALNMPLAVWLLINVVLTFYVPAWWGCRRSRPTIEDQHRLTL